MGKQKGERKARAGTHKSHRNMVGPVALSVLTTRLCYQLAAFPLAPYLSTNNRLRIELVELLTANNLWDGFELFFFSSNKLFMILFLSFDQL